MCFSRSYLTCPQPPPVIQGKGWGWVTRSKGPPAMSQRVAKKTVILKLQTDFDDDGVKCDECDHWMVTFHFQMVISPTKAIYIGCIGGSEFKPFPDEASSQITSAQKTNTNCIYQQQNSERGICIVHCSLHSHKRTHSSYLMLLQWGGLCTWALILGSGYSKKTKCSAGSS